MRANHVLSAVTVLLFLAAVLVRGIEGEPPAAPVQDVDAPGAIEEPIQLLSRAGGWRLAELDGLISPERQAAWRDTRLLLDRLEGCPGIVKWLAKPEGQRLEQLVARLSRGTREEGLAALGLLFRLASVTDWDSDGAESAGRLGGLLQEWLALWGERGAEDGLLYEPTLAAVILYGAVMQVAYEDGWFGDSERSLERARGFLGPLLAARSGLRTRLGAALEAAHPGIVPVKLEGSKFLRGLAEEAELLFPDLGDCD